MSPDEIHALIKRSGKTERRNGKVKTQVGFEGTLLEFF
jgi:hypothetical protein